MFENQDLNKDQGLYNSKTVEKITRDLVENRWTEQKIQAIPHKLIVNPGNYNGPLCEDSLKGYYGDRPCIGFNLQEKITRYRQEKNKRTPYYTLDNIKIYKQKDRAFKLIELKDEEDDKTHITVLGIVSNKIYTIAYYSIKNASKEHNSLDILEQIAGGNYNRSFGNILEYIVSKIYTKTKDEKIEITESHGNNQRRKQDFYEVSINISNLSKIPRSIRKDVEFFKRLNAMNISSIFNTNKNLQNLILTKDTIEFQLDKMNTVHDQMDFLYEIQKELRI